MVYTLSVHGSEIPVLASVGSLSSLRVTLKSNSE